jgi:hypothetical protein
MKGREVQLGTAWRVAVIVCLVAVGLSVTACKPRYKPSTVQAGAPVETGTVQATMSIDSTVVTAPAVVASDGVSPAAADAGSVLTQDAAGNFNAAPGSTPISGPWPAKVGLFAKGFKGEVWYPKAIPSGYKADSIDIVELDKSTGLVCDIVYLNGENAIQLTQGSPKGRNYDIVSVGKVPWGTGKADIVHQDPADTTTPIAIVYSGGGTFAELSGDVSDVQLKAIAASMVAVK